MKILGGIEVLTELQEIVDPRHTALLVVDVQHDFCSPDGVAGKLGRDLSIIQPAIPRIARIVDEARRFGALVVFIQNVWLPGNRSTGGSWLRFSMHASCVNPEQGWTTLDSWGARILPETGVRPDDIIVQKYRSSAFFGTQLATILRANRIRSVVCVGFVTEGCLESTARDAMFHDYYTVVASDCVGTFKKELHEAALTVLRVRCDVVESSAVLAAWQGTPRAAATPSPQAAEPV
jgi:nicotinamidase-related amidase